MRNVIVPFLCALLAGCGSGSTSVASKKKDVTPAPPAEQKECPATPPSNAHLVSLNFPRAMPAKMALKLEGDADFRLSDCAETTQRGVIATWARATNMQLQIMVEHGSALNNRLPESQSLEVFDLQNCGPLAATFFKTAAPLKISWRLEYPKGQKCAGRAYGEAGFQALAY